MDNKLSAIIKYKLPDYVRDEHEMFVAFVQAYVEYLEEEGNWLNYMNRFQRNLDVDRADNDFIERYLAEFASTFPHTTKIPTNQLLKLMREFYLSKGSEDSFRFIFTVLFDADIEIIYPREYMYVPSSGEYAAESMCYITGDNWFKLNIDNSDLNASLEGTTSGSTAVLDTITSTYLDGVRVSKLEVSSYDGQFIPGESVVLTVDDQEVIETVKGSIAHINVNDGGTNYTLGDTLTITDTSGGQRAIAKINQLAKGGLTQVNIVNPGTGYAVGDVVKTGGAIGSNGFGFRARVYEVGGSGEILRVRVDAPGYDYTKKVNANVKSSGGTGAIIELNGDNVGKIESIEVIDGGIGYVDAGTITITIDSDEGTGAVLTPVVSGIFTAPKRYLNEKSTPSGNSKIMDSYYYQQYSYVIGSSVSPHKWLGTVKRIAHPAGTQLFGMYKLENDADISVSVAPGIANTITRTVSMMFDNEVNYDFSITQSRTLMRQSHDACQLGLVLSDLDDIKFYSTFDWTIGDFADYSIEDIEDNCSPLIEKQDSSELTIT